MNYGSKKSKKDRRDPWNKPLAEVLATPPQPVDPRVAIWLKELDK